MDMDTCSIVDKSYILASQAYQTYLVEFLTQRAKLPNSGISCTNHDSTVFSSLDSSRQLPHNAHYRQGDAMIFEWVQHAICALNQHIVFSIETIEDSLFDDELDTEQDSDNNDDVDASTHVTVAQLFQHFETQPSSACATPSSSGAPAAFVSRLRSAVPALVVLVPAIRLPRGVASASPLCPPLPQLPLQPLCLASRSASNIASSGTAASPTTSTSSGAPFHAVFAPSTLLCLPVVLCPSAVLWEPADDVFPEADEPDDFVSSDARSASTPAPVEACDSSDRPRWSDMIDHDKHSFYIGAALAADNVCFKEVDAPCFDVNPRNEIHVVQQPSQQQMHQQQLQQQHVSNHSYINAVLTAEALPFVHCDQNRVFDSYD
jgi:hypothetical protein